MHYILKKIKIADFILIVLLILAGVISSFYLYGNKYKNKKVIVELSGKTYGIYDLNKNTIINLKGQYSDVKINIENGYVFVSESKCPQKLCIKMGRKNKVNDVIVCIPNRLIIRIEGEEENNFEFITR
jgi:hypothetical protein